MESLRYKKPSTSQDGNARMAVRQLPSDNWPDGQRPDMGAPLPAHLVPGGDADSAGFTWAGRTFDHHGTAFADDDGTAPEPYVNAVHSVRNAVRELAGAESAQEQIRALAALAQAHAQAVAACTGVRFLVPLIAQAGAYGRTPEGKLVEKSQELSIVTVEAPDGRTAMPIFSSTEAMSAWNKLARPIPVPGPQVALAAAQEETDLVVIDPGSPETEYVVRRPHLEALALGEERIPSWADPEVVSAFEASIIAEQHVRGITLAPGDPKGTLAGSETIVGLTLDGGLERDTLGSIVQRLQTSWANDDTIASRVDSIAVQLRR